MPAPSRSERGHPVRAVSFHYGRGDANIIENLSLTIAPGEKVGLVGVSGAGKTTSRPCFCGCTNWKAVAS